MRSNYYQIALIIFSAIATAFFSIFVYREFFPDYRVFQNRYEALENFRSTYTHKPPPEFVTGVKQILIETPNNGEPIIDRCVSCHVALDIPYFSATKLAYDVNGKILLDEKGNPVKIPNEDYIWGKLEQRIKELTDPQVNEQLKSEGRLRELADRLKEAEELSHLKKVEINGHVFDVTKALSMHPLIGRETRPFEYHPVADYGCTSCHGGNGRALTVDKAHGPVFDEQYEAEFRGFEPRFLELDPDNDPQFSRVFNHKPSDELIFQTTPILVGDLIEAKCMQCHQSGEQSILRALGQTQNVSRGTEKIIQAIATAYENSKNSLISLLKLKFQIEQNGFNKTVTQIQQELDQYLVPPDNRQSVQSQLNFLMQNVSKSSDEQQMQQAALQKINIEIQNLLGTPSLVQQLEDQLNPKEANLQFIVEKFIQDHRSNPEAIGALFVKADSLDLEQTLLHHVRDTETSFSKAVNDQMTMNAIQTDVDRLTETYQRGKELYIQQACYACHRISGFTRGGVGPELTKIGKNYPWYIKHHIVWPQGDLPTSTMPNARLDHEELEPLMTFLLAQRGPNETVSKSEYKRTIAEWEAGKEQPWEKPITPAQMYDLRYSMTVFATEGCASCHRLKGFESDVGYRVEKNKKASFEELYKEREWFTKLFPEELLGSKIVEILDKHAEEIDQHIVEHVRQGSILEEIEKNYPQSIESFYTNFRFASRAKNHVFEEKLKNETDTVKKKLIHEELEKYKERLHRVLMIYIQEYGLGRLIGPRPNWSGIFRSDAWLMEHFFKPTSRIPRSIMPVFPFDETKFYALTHMLDVLSSHNRDWDRQVWELKGFNPALAYQLYCSQCHGEFLGGNGPVSPWIYPIPKNLRNAEFLRNYTRERIVNSITHGVKGTPMPPWGEVAEGKASQGTGPVLNKAEINQLVDWLFSTLPGATILQHPEDVPKWNYQPEDVLKELENEGSRLKSNDESPLSALNLPDGREYLAARGPALPLESKNQDASVSDIFDIVPNPPGSPDKNSYYIKRKFYTSENIQAGKEFFNIYCAVCHGSEADGMGPRSAVMQEAKPRMLTDLDWLNSHDDMYLLRSIKYGVPGTSMNAWGDQTNSLLRVQLAIFIRSLSEDSKKFQKLDETLYHVFDAEDFKIDAARLNEVKILQQTQNQFDAASKLQRKVFQEVQTNPALQKEALEAYQKQLELSEKLNQERSKDEIFLNLKESIAQEKKIYKDLGYSLLAAKINGQIFQNYLNLISQLSGRFVLQDNNLEFKFTPSNEQKFEEAKAQIIKNFNREIQALKDEQKLIQAKIPSNSIDQRAKEIDSQLKTLSSSKDRLKISFQQAIQLRQTQTALINKLNQKQK